MAILAGPTVGCDMGKRLAGSDDAIVATDTGSTHSRVVHPANASPAESGVTEFAAIGRLYVTGTLTRTDGAIVTIAAIVRHVTVVETGVTPVRGGMTIVTLIIGLHVIRVLAIRPDIVMAALALLGRTHEQAIEVAAVALKIAMSASQGETGGEVIEITDSSSSTVA